jgi:D-alanyl-D-alanine carboxypeptidase
VIYEKNADEQLEPACVTNVMTILLIVEAMAIEAGTIGLDDMVAVSATPLPWAVPRSILKRRDDERPQTAQVHRRRLGQRRRRRLAEYVSDRNPSLSQR